LTNYGLTKLTTTAQSETSIAPTAFLPLVTDTTYHWVVDTYEPNTVPIFHPGRYWRFETVPSTPAIDTDPLRTAVFPGETAVLTAGFSSISALTGSTWEVSTDLGTTWAAATGSVTLDEVSTPKTSTLTITSVTVAEEGLYRCTVTNASGSDTSGSAGLAVKRQVASYEFEDDLTDTIHGNNGTATNRDPNRTIDVGYTDGVVAGTKALLLNATTVPADPNQSYVVLPSTAYPKAGPGGAMEAGTILCWVKSQDTAGAIMGSANVGYGTMCFVAYNSTRFTPLIRGEGATNFNPSVSNPNPNDGQWHFLAVRWEVGGTNRAYAGTLTENGIGGGIQNAAASATFVPFENPLLIGASNNRGTVADVLSNTAIDKLVIYNYALTDDQIADIYNTVSGQSLCVHTYANTYDFNGNCTVDLPDFAKFAEGWLSAGLSFGL